MEVETFETRIEKLVTGGAGLGRCEGRAAFIPLTAPGDLVSARVVRRQKGFVQAELADLLEAGSGRQEPACPHFGECGGCDLQHLTGESQRQAKAAILGDCFARLGKLDPADILAGPEPVGSELGYRNRIRLFASPAGLYGLMRRGSHDVVPLETCLQMPERFTAEILPWLRTMPPVEQIALRLDGRGNWLVSLFGQPNRARLLKRILADLIPGEPPLAGCTGVLFNNLPFWGRDYLVQQVAGKKYRVSARSFFQANLEVTGAAVALVREWLAGSREPGGLLLDLYCGVGLFSLALSDLFERGIALDADPHAVRDAANNVKRDAGATGKVEVVAEKVDRFLARAVGGGAGPARTIGAPVPEPTEWQDACCVLDPPRAGLGPEVTAALAELAPRDLLYLSCDPATLARDCAALTGAGYRLARLQALDMFPQTAHLETLAHLVRG